MNEMNNAQSLHKSTPKKSIRRKLTILNIIVMILANSILITVMNLTENGWIAFVFGVGIILASSTIFYMRLGRIVDPLQKLDQRLDQMAMQCDFSSEVPFVETGDEVQSLCESVRYLRDVQQRQMGDLVRVLGQLAANDLDVQLEGSYAGDYQLQKQALENIIQKLNASLWQIGRSTHEIFAATGQVAQGMQEISQGTVEQGSAVETLVGVIHENSQLTMQNAEDSARASSLSTEAGQVMMQGSSYMESLLEAMHEVSEASQKIGKVIKTVDDIAFQTNILALNASVEAARAGAAGKGFAVVADEVRNLANKSADASRGTAELIQSAMQAAERGTKMAQDTARIIQEVGVRAQEATRLTNQIAGAMQTQVTGATQMERDIQRISQVVQSNTSSAEEGAAAGEELSNQTQVLKEMVGQFRLREEHMILSSSR